MFFYFHIFAATSALTRALRKKSPGRFDTCLEPLGSQLKLKIGRGVHGTYFLYIWWVWEFYMFVNFVN